MNLIIYKYIVNVYFKFLGTVAGLLGMLGVMILIETD